MTNRSILFAGLALWASSLFALPPLGPLNPTAENLYTRLGLHPEHAAEYAYGHLEEAFYRAYAESDPSTAAGRKQIRLYLEAFEKLVNPRAKSEYDSEMVGRSPAEKAPQSPQGWYARHVAHWQEQMEMRFDAERTRLLIKRQKNEEAFFGAYFKTLATEFDSLEPTNLQPLFMPHESLWDQDDKRNPADVSRDIALSAVVDRFLQTRVPFFANRPSVEDCEQLSDYLDRLGPRVNLSLRTRIWKTGMELARDPEDFHRAAIRYMLDLLHTDDFESKESAMRMALEAIVEKLGNNSPHLRQIVYSNIYSILITRVMKIIDRDFRAMRIPQDALLLREKLNIFRVQVLNLIRFLYKEHRGQAYSLLFDLRMQFRDDLVGRSTLFSQLRSFGHFCDASIDNVSSIHVSPEAVTASGAGGESKISDPHGLMAYFDSFVSVFQKEVEDLSGQLFPGSPPLNSVGGSGGNSCVVYIVGKGESEPPSILPKRTQNQNWRNQ